MGAENSFDVEKYVRRSRKVDISDLDLSRTADYPLTADEIRCLTYMMDIEGHTIVYLKSILNTCAIRDPQTTAFLSCWAYEEFFHSYTLRQFLEASGVAVSANRVVEVQEQASWRVWMEQMVASLICQMSKHFHAVYLTWGAISELTTLEGYQVLAGRTRNPLLAEILRRLAKDERRHFSFYYLLQQGENRVAIEKRAAADKIHPAKILDASGRGRKARLGSGVDRALRSRRCSRRRGGREN